MRAAMKNWVSSMRILILVILSIVSSTHGYPDPAADKSKHSILGKWDSRIRSNGSGLTLEFLSDGTFRENADFEKEGRYALKENHLITYTWDVKVNHLITYTWDVKESREKQRAFDLKLGGDHITMR